VLLVQAVVVLVMDQMERLEQLILVVVQEAVAVEL
jgi:hypothetical protein